MFSEVFQTQTFLGKKNLKVKCAFPSWDQSAHLTECLLYNEHVMHFSKLGFITRPKYLDIFVPNALRVAIGQLGVSSHQNI